MVASCRPITGQASDVLLPREEKVEAGQSVGQSVALLSIDYFFPRGKWATLGGSAISRQPVAGTRQASFPRPSSKNQFNI